MEGVTTAIVGFIFVCLIWPSMVKSKPQFYSSIGLLMVIILFDAIAHMALNKEDSALFRVMYVLTALLQMLTVLILVMCVGGLSARELHGEFSDTIQAIRRGGDEKSVLVPLKGEQPMPKEDQPPPRQTITLSDKDDSSIPLE